MLSISLIREDQAWYYERFGTEGYYVSGQSNAPQFMGKGAERLGIRGDIKDPQVLSNLLSGYSPDGSTTLRRSAGTEPRLYTTKDGTEEKHYPRAAWDMTFSAPKSLSVLYGASEEKERELIARCYHLACEKAIKVIEPETRVRTGPGGKERERIEGLIIASFPA